MPVCTNLLRCLSVLESLIKWLWCIITLLPGISLLERISCWILLCLLLTRSIRRNNDCFLSSLSIVSALNEDSFRCNNINDFAVFSSKVPETSSEVYSSCKYLSSKKLEMYSSCNSDVVMVSLFTVNKILKLALTCLEHRLIILYANNFLVLILFWEPLSCSL